MLLGEKIKQLRQQCGLTQEELADRCELTKGYISQIENDLTSPSIATFEDIVSALGVSVKEFFADYDDEEKIVFTEQEFIEKVSEESTQNWLVPNAQKNEMEPLHIVLNGHSSTPQDNPHEGEEFGYVLNGEIKIHLGKKVYKCKKGESFYFTADKLHYIENSRTQSATFIWISSPPTF